MHCICSTPSRIQARHAYFLIFKTLRGLQSPDLSMADYGHPTRVVPWIKICLGDSSFIAAVLGCEIYCQLLNTRFTLLNAHLFDYVCGA